MNFENLMFRNTDLSKVYGGYNNNVYGNSCGCNNTFGNFFGSILSGMFMGGFGNSIFGCMGGYNNYFGNMFMGGYNYGYGSSCCGDARSALRFQLGSMLGSFAVMFGSHFINKAIQEKQTNSLDAKLENKNSEIQKALKELGTDVTESNYTSHKAEDKPEYKTKLTELDKSNSDLNAKITEYTHDSKYLDEAGIAALKQQRDALVLTDPNTKDENIAKYNELNQKIKDAEAINKKIKELEEKLEQNKEAQEKLNEKIAARQKEIDNVKAKIANLIKERDEIKAKIKTENDARTMERADGNIFNRTTDKNFGKIYDFGNKDFGKKDDGTKYSAADLTSADLRYLINKYKNGNVQDKKEVKEFLTAHKDEIKDNAKKGSIAEGIKLIIG